MSTTSGIKRSAQACRTCRQQKMKCSGGPEPCTRCSRARRKCVFEPTSSISSSPPFPSCSSSSQKAANKSTQGDFQRQLAPTPTLSLDTPNERLPPAKRRRLNTADGQDITDTSQQLNHPISPLSPETPYSAVQNLEFPALDGRTSPTEAYDPALEDNHVDESLFALLCEAGIQVFEAEQMFYQFGLRVAPFIPTLYDVDFSKLPSSPMFAIAAIHAIARYLPDSFKLRSALWDLLRRCLQDITFDVPDRKNPRSIETMHGLVILYSYAEASGPSTHKSLKRHGPDMVTMRSITEGYALKMGIGGMNKVQVHDSFSNIILLWLYTMGHHSSALHGCARTMSASPEILQAKSFLEQTANQSRLKTLIGEAELCMIWERLRAETTDISKKLNQELDSWTERWAQFLSQAEGRHLAFHAQFARFQLSTSLVYADVESSSCNAATQINAARAFIHVITTISPISKDRLRYMCDFGFVMIVYACVFILRAAKTNAFENQKSELIKDVEDVALLLKSFSTSKTTRPAIYGFKLSKLCAEGRNRSGTAECISNQPQASPAMLGYSFTSDMNLAPNTNPATINGSMLSPCSIPGFNIESPSAQISVNGSIRTEMNENIVTLDSVPPGSIRTMADLWGFDPNMFIFGDLGMETIPALDHY